MVNFGKFSSENTVIFNDFSPKMTVVRPKYVSWGSNQEGVLLTRMRYVIQEKILVVCTYLIQEKWGNVLDVSNAP